MSDIFLSGNSHGLETMGDWKRAGKRDFNGDFLRAFETRQPNDARSQVLPCAAARPGRKNTSRMCLLNFHTGDLSALRFLVQIFPSYLICLELQNQYYRRNLSIKFSQQKSMQAKKIQKYD